MPTERWMLISLTLSDLNNCYLCVHHGMTVSMFYADPDGNQMEFQVEFFGSGEADNAFTYGPKRALVHHCHIF